MNESETRGFKKTRYDSNTELKNAKKQAFFAEKPLTDRALCQKKQLENPIKPKFIIPKIKENLTIIKIVTPPTSPKKTVYPPLQPGEDILETDLKFSESESESEREAINTPVNKEVEKPTQRVHQSLGKSRLDSSVFETANRPPTIVHTIRTTSNKLIQSCKRPNPFAWPKNNPPAKRAPATNFTRLNTEVVCPQAISTQPATIIINNYYRGVPYHPPQRPAPQCTDPTRMSRGQFRRFLNRKTTTQDQINQALAIRNSFKNQSF